MSPGTLRTGVATATGSTIRSSRLAGWLAGFKALFGSSRRLVLWSYRAAIALLLYLAVLLHTMPNVFAGPWSWPSLAALVETLFFPERPPPPPPHAWREAARGSDVLAVPGTPIAYWGRIDAPYGDRVTRHAKAPLAIVVHFTDETPAVTLVEYGHRADPHRGNAAYGYHFYIDRAGRVLQGAPLGVRTNHVKPSHAGERVGATTHLDGSNTIGVALIGACRSPPLSPITYRCPSDQPTAAQVASGLAVVAALQQRFSMPCTAIYGHGELQTDRKSFEGQTLTERQRRRC